VAQLTDRRLVYVYLKTPSSVYTWRFRPSGLVGVQRFFSSAEATLLDFALQLMVGRCDAEWSTVTMACDDKISAVESDVQKES